MRISAGSPHGKKSVEFQVHTCIVYNAGIIHLRAEANTNVAVEKRKRERGGNVIICILCIIKRFRKSYKTEEFCNIAETNSAYRSTHNPLTIYEVQRGQNKNENHDVIPSRE